MVPYLSEFIGTIMLVVLGDGICAANTLNHSNFQGSGPVYVIVGWGIAVGLPAMAFGAQSGAHFNPSVTIAMACLGKLGWNMVPGYIICQLLGGVIGGIIVYLFYKPQFDASTEMNNATLRGIFCTAGAIDNKGANAFSEFLATFFLLFFILTIPASIGAASASAFVVALIIMSCGFSLGATTGFSMNAARDWGPRLAYTILPIKPSDQKDAAWGYAWISGIMPILGGICGALVGNMVVGWL
ncbi:MIP/aquaporin family protein [Pseudoramibacter sp.]|jgi:glycerol uptake facilitator protein|uniref:MIP/aquaporin family protein n=1 Tax=Pseudoramibacter sp. TaxID=2034862 RepID=UPI0025EC8734|nr:MIP/aquaporin family protein [Pseudoramibacter sp.]MCH4071505.1 aquaporin family protein [Pseudoramibacter sp.]MCH4105273.1 aquaporin family protein [Pseudoramibacter sp.]